jgi:hypothetical protein
LFFEILVTKEISLKNLLYRQKDVFILDTSAASLHLVGIGFWFFDCKCEVGSAVSPIVEKFGCPWE